MLPQTLSSSTFLPPATLTSKSCAGARSADAYA
jgi:hypothetical protein